VTEQEANKMHPPNKEEANKMQPVVSGQSLRGTEQETKMQQPAAAPNETNSQLYIPQRVLSKKTVFETAGAGSSNSRWHDRYLILWEGCSAAEATWEPTPFFDEVRSFSCCVVVLVAKDKRSCVIVALRSGPSWSCSTRASACPNGSWPAGRCKWPGCTRCSGYVHDSLFLPLLRGVILPVYLSKADHKETTLESPDSMELCSAVVESGRVRGSKAVVEQLLAEFDARESLRHQQHKRRRDSLNE